MIFSNISNVEHKNRSSELKIFELYTKIYQLKRASYAAAAHQELRQEEGSRGGFTGKAPQRAT